MKEIDPFYPKIDIHFIDDQIKQSKKIVSESRIKIGSTIMYVLHGNQALHKRKIILREVEPGEVGLDQATGLAIRLSFLSKLMDWLEENKDWKEGGYKMPNS